MANAEKLDFAKGIHASQLSDGGGDDDQIVPTGITSLVSAKIIKGATLKVLPGAPHGICSTLKDQINAELVAFFKGVAAAAA